MRRLVALALTAALSCALPAAAQAQVSEVLDSAAAVRALRALPAPDLPPGIPPLFLLVFDTAGTLERAEPVFRGLPATFTDPVLAILTAHVRPLWPSSRLRGTYLRVVTGRAASIGEANVRTTAPQLINHDVIGEVLRSRIDSLIPAEELSAGLRVRIEVHVNEDGAADSLVVVVPSGNRTADSLAVDAVRQMRFRPGTIESVPARVRTIVPIQLAIPDSAGADDPSPTEPAATVSLDGVDFPVPTRYRPVPALSDAHLAVFADARTETAFFVATVPDGMHRTDAMERARMHVANAALGGGPRSLEWFFLPSFLVSPHEIYHERRLGYDFRLGLLTVVQLRRLRIGGRDVITGYAFPIADDEARRQLGRAEPASRHAADEVSERIVAAIAGGTPVSGVPVMAPPADGGTAEHPEAAAVRAAWSALGTAWEAKDKEGGPALVAQPYLEYLDDMRHLALHAPARVVREEPLTNLKYVLYLRHVFPPERLREMDARQLLRNLFGERMSAGALTMSTLLAFSAHRVSVEGDLAFAWLERASAPYVFRREDGEWKKDVLPSLFRFEYMLYMILGEDARQGLSRDESLLDSIVAMSGRRAPKLLWDPP